jgi:tricorn protease interacting factor F2/3
MKEERETLGNNVMPINYDINFEPDLKTFKYKCREAISVKILKSTKIIKINSLNLKIKKALVIKNKETLSAKVKTDEKLGQIALMLNSSVSGNAEIVMECEGCNWEKLSGFYRSTFKLNGKDHYWLTSQFEPADARRAFPCFDEPAFKATFNISFLIDKKLNALSNMPEKFVKDLGSKKLVTFKTTPKMSSYLVYLCVGEFKVLKGTYGKIKINVVTTSDKIALAETALDYGKKFLKYYDDYFGVKYPLPKMDFIAVPDFAIGGMENWGAITYSEIGLLVDKKAISVGAKQRIAELTSHELAHQWFGDLVTMKWWDNLWLNESFATFMSYKAMKKVFPEWNIDIQAILSRTAGALGADQLRSTQPIGVKVNSVNDMAEAFDSSITYSKGAAVLAMLEDYMGADAFRNGIRHYIKKYSYTNATEHDLWNALGKVAKNGSKFDSLASYWINTPGYPMIEVKYDNKEIELSQRRFFLIDKEDSSLWPVPMHYIKKDKAGKKEGLLLLDKRKLKIREKDLDYIKLNYGQKGFYRVKYPNAILDKLGKLVKDKGISGLDAWGIESDLYSIARASRIKASVYLDFVEKYCMNAEFPLDISVSNHINAIYLLLRGNNRISARAKEISLKYHRNIINKLGWDKKENESNTTVILRNTALYSLGMLDDQKTLDKAKGLFDNYLKNGTAIEPNIRAVVYRLNGRTADSKTFEKIIELYKKEQMPEDKIKLLQSIGSVKNPEQIRKALEFTLSKDVRMQYADLIPNFVSNEDYGKKAVWPWIKRHWKKLMSMYEPGGAGGLTDFVDILSIMDDRKTRKDIESFFSKKANYRDDVKRSVSKTLEYIDINIRFKEFNDN